MDSSSIALPAEVVNETSVILLDARSMSVTDPETYIEAAELLKGIKGLRRKIADFFTPLKRKQDEAKRAILDAEKEQDRPLIEAERIIKGRLDTYDARQRDLQVEEERGLREQVRRLEEERRLADAIELEAHGNVAAAEDLLAAPAPQPVISVPLTTPKVAGISYSTLYSAEVTDLVALARFVGANPQFANLIQPNMVALNAQARSLKDAMNIPGVRASSKRSVSSGR